MVKCHFFLLYIWFPGINSTPRTESANAHEPCSQEKLSLFASASCWGFFIQTSAQLGPAIRQDEDDWCFQLTCLTSSETG